MKTHAVDRGREFVWSSSREVRVAKTPEDAEVGEIRRHEVKDLVWHTIMNGGGWTTVE